MNNDLIHCNKELYDYLSYIKECWYLRFSKKKKREIFIQINNKKNSNIFIYSVLITFPAYTYLIFYLDIFKFRLKFNFIC